jgi:hypothetical protein
MRDGLLLEVFVSILAYNRARKTANNIKLGRTNKGCEKTLPKAITNNASAGAAIFANRST